MQKSKATFRDRRDSRAVNKKVFKCYVYETLLGNLGRFGPGLFRLSYFGQIVLRISFMTHCIHSVYRHSGVGKKVTLLVVYKHLNQRNTVGSRYLEFQGTL